MKILKVGIIFWLTVLTLGLVTITDAGEREFSASRVAEDCLIEYSRSLDEFIQPIREENASFVPSTETILDTRTIEYRLVWFWQNGLLKKLPPLVMTNSFRNKKEIPGAILEARAKSLGIDIWDQGLENKWLTYAEHEWHPNRKGKSFLRPLCSTNYPVDFLGENAYATHLTHKRDWSEAAEHFTKANEVPHGGTVSGEWEVANSISAAWSFLMAGDYEKSREAIETAREFELKGEFPQRGRVLLHLYRISEAPNLGAPWDALLPKQ